MAKKKNDAPEDTTQQEIIPGTDAVPQPDADNATGGTENNGADNSDANPDADATQQAGADNSGNENKSEETKKDTKKAKEPKVSDSLSKIGKSLLGGHPGMSVVYMTSDGRGFYEKNDADNHARSLKDKTVTPVKK